MEAENAENPGDPKPEAAGVLNENEAADVTCGFPSPKAGVEAETAEPVADTAPNAGRLPNTEGFPDVDGANPELALKLKF